MILMASLWWINQRRIKVKEQLELLFRGILSWINQIIQFSKINILQNYNTNFSQAFGDSWDSEF